MNDKEPLDLEAIIQEHESKRRRNRWLALGLALLASVSVAQLVALSRLREGAYNRPTTLLMLPYLDWNSWTMGDDVLPGAPLALRVSPTGTLWVATSAGLSRANWADWQWQHADWDAGSGTIQPSSLVLADGAAWLMIGSGLARFDGRAWATLSYPDGVTLDTALQIAAANTGLFLLDRSGTIYFSPAGSGAWEQATDLTALEFASGGDARPEMAVSYGGAESVPSVWVAYRGLWHWSPGGEWQQICLGDDCLIAAHFTATPPETPWTVTVLNGDEVIKFEWAQGLAWPNYFSLTDSGLYAVLPPGDGVSDVVGRAERLWAATGDGVYTYEFVPDRMGEWERVPLPDLLAGQMQDLTAMPGGPPVMIARVQESAQTSGALGRVLGVTSSMSLLALAAGFLWALSRSGVWPTALPGRVRAYALIQEAVSSLPPWELPASAEELAKRSPWKRRLTLMLIKVVVAATVLCAIQRFWPQGVGWGFLIALLIMFLPDLLFPSKEDQARTRLQRQILLESLADQAKTPQEQERLRALAARPETASRRSTLVGVLITLAVVAALIVIVWVVLRVGMPLLFKMGSGWGVGVVLLTFVVLLFGVSYVVTMAPAWTLKGILNRGDYDTALQRAETATRGQSRPTQLFFQGTVLMLAGRHEEGERALRDCLVAGRGTAASEQQSVALENLGWVLIAQGRYDEAVRALETAIRLRPGGSDSYAVLAEAYLFQGIEPEKALALARRAVLHKRRRFLWGLLVDRYVYANAWADQAWALALLGDYAAADKALAHAFRVAEKRFRPAFAGVHYRAGRVKQLMGEWEAATVHYTAAAELDPVGHYGRLGRQALGTGQETIST